MDMIYDNIFKTMVTRNPHLLIPLVNDIFDEHYSYDEKVVLLSDEHQTLQNDYEGDERITDSYISINGANYHLECQSNPDGTIVFRMIEYDFHIALDQAVRTARACLKFPRAAVLYLRHNSKTKDKLSIDVEFPNDQKVLYEIKIVKAKDIPKDEIIQKKLYFLVPYYIMRVEDEPLQKVLDDYIDLLTAMSHDRDAGVFTEYDMASVRVGINRLINQVYSDDSIRRGVENLMGGKVLYSEIDRIYDEGIEKGIEKGIEQNSLSSIKNLMNSLKISADEAMSYLGIAEDDRDKYLKKLAE